MRTFIVFCSLLASSLLSVGQTTRNMWVGETFTCDATSAVMGLTSDMNWSVSGGYYSQSGSGFYRNIQVTQYFSGTMTVTCSWKYRLYSGDQWRTQSRSWYFTCQNNPLILSPSNMELSVGERAYVSFGHQYTNSYSSYARPYVQSSNSNVVEVDANTGEIYAVGPGTTYVTAYSQLSGDAPYCKITVKKVDPTSVSIPSSMTAYVGESSKISATLRPSNAQTTFTWYSSNSSVASVSSGSVTGKSEGTATVYVTTANGLRSNDCAVTVKYRVPTGVSVSKSTLYLPIGHSEQLTSAVTPSNAKYTLTWSSDNPNVASVSSDGRITAKKQGTARIKVATDNGYSATCTVTVPPMPSKLILPSKVALQYGKSRTLKCTAEPADAYLALQWSSSNTDVATVSQKGEVTARGAGEAIIIAKAEGGLEAKCQVVVEEPKHCFIVWTKDGGRVDYLMKDHPVVTNEGDNLVLTTRNIRVEYPKTDVRKYTFEDQTTDPYPTMIEMASALTLPYRQTLQMEYTLLPAEFDIETRLTWQSSAPHIVSVDQTGRLLARCNGEAVITATASNGASASCLVAVTDVQIYLVVWTRDGDKVLYSLNEQPSIKYDGEGNFVVRTSRVEVVYPVVDVRMFTLADTDNPRPDEPMSIPDVSSDSGFRFSDEAVSFSSLPQGSLVRIYSTSGMLIGSVKADESGSASINLSDLTQGVYIIKTENITHKIIKK